MHSIVCPTCFTSPNPSETIIYSKPHQVRLSAYSPPHKNHKHSRSQIFPNRVLSTEKPVWSLKLLIRRLFGGGIGKTCCQQKSNVNCYRRKVILADVERKHKIMQRDVVRARRSPAYGRQMCYAKRLGGNNNI